MHNYWYAVPVSMLMGALIGGVTNHLAIKMLFHPRQAWVWRKWKVPFTPGLIPKRKQEIGSSLGHVVSEYLVTTHGLVGVLRKPQFRQKVTDQLNRWIAEWTLNNESADQILSRHFSQEQIAEGKIRLEAALRVKMREFAVWLWEKRGLSDISISTIIPQWSEGKKEELAEKAAAWIAVELRQVVLSTSGGQLLRQLAGQLMQQTGGFLGTLAGIFIDEGKIIERVRSAIVAQLDSPAVRLWLSALIVKKLEQAETVRLAEWVNLFTHKDGKEWLADKLDTSVRWQEWFDQLGSIPLSRLAEPVRGWLLAAVPHAAHYALSVLESNAEKIMEAIKLPQLVEEQVERFPVEQLEQIVLSVSGKEFRAITWLGAILGGMIGLLQPLLVVWIR